MIIQRRSRLTIQTRSLLLVFELLLFLLAASVLLNELLHAQTITEAPRRLDHALYAADLTVRALDFKTTRDFLRSPCHCFTEADPIAPHTAAIGPQAVFQFGLSAAIIIGSRELTKHHHPRWARALLIADIVDESIAVGNNLQLHSRPKIVSPPTHVRPVRR